MFPTSPWIGVGELAQSFLEESNALPLTADLSGKTLSLHFADGRTVEYKFQTDHRLVWRAQPCEIAASSAEETYWACKIRDGIYLVDYVEHQKRATATSLVLDVNCGAFTAVVGQLPTEAEARLDFLSRTQSSGELTGVRVDFSHGSIDRIFAAQPPYHRITDEMIGRRVEYTYSPTQSYEHVYLNAQFYTWHCLLGSEKGLADTDRCHYYKLGDELYLFVWREKIIPTLGVVVVDFTAMRSNGKIFGYEGNDFRKVVHFRVGAKGRLLNVTRPPAVCGDRQSPASRLPNAGA